MSSKHGGFHKLDFEIYTMGKPKNGSFFETVCLTVSDLAPAIEPIPLLVFTKRGEKIELHRPLSVNSELEKDMIALYIEKLVASGIDEVILVTEAWTVEVPVGEMPITTPSKHPDRKEIFSITYSTKEKEEMWAADIIREGATRKLSEWRLREEMTNATGRFVNLFRKAENKED